MFIHLYVLAYSEWRNIKVIENERINIPNLKAHFEHLGVNSRLRFEFVHPVCIWIGLPTLNLHHMLLVVCSGNSDLNYILHNLIAINKVWKKCRISKKKLFSLNQDFNVNYSIFKKLPLAQHSLVWCLRWTFSQWCISFWNGRLL